MTIHYVIPARKGSKGFPGKNRKLWQHTFDTIPAQWHDRTILTTDDYEISKMGARVNVRSRPADLCTDEANMRDVLTDVVKWWGMTPDDIVVLLYLTYPERETPHISDATAIFQSVKGKSMLCKKKPLTDPYMCIYDDGEQVISHDLYRRQDYPVTHEISHFIGVFRVSEIPKLNRNLYNKETFFMPIERFIDVDTEEDLQRVAK